MAWRGSRCSPALGGAGGATAFAGAARALRASGGAGVCGGVGRQAGPPLQPPHRPGAPAPLVQGTAFCWRGRLPHLQRPPFLQSPQRGWLRRTAAAALPGRAPASSHPGPGSAPQVAGGCKARRPACLQTPRGATIARASHPEPGAVIRLRGPGPARQGARRAAARASSPNARRAQHGSATRRTRPRGVGRPPPAIRAQTTRTGERFGLAGAAAARGVSRTPARRPPPMTGACPFHCPPAAQRGLCHHTGAPRRPVACRTRRSRSGSGPSAPVREGRARAALAPPVQGYWPPRPAGRPTGLRAPGAFVRAAVLSCCCPPSSGPTPLPSSSVASALFYCGLGDGRRWPRCAATAC